MIRITDSLICLTPLSFSFLLCSYLSPILQTPLFSIATIVGAGCLVKLSVKDIKRISAQLKAAAGGGAAIAHYCDSHTAQREQRILEWLLNMTSTPLATGIVNKSAKDLSATTEDWQAIEEVCGHGERDFHDAYGALPLTAAEINHFRRNHRNAGGAAERDFAALNCDLPPPLAKLYGQYRYQARLDAEATLFVAVATGSPRIAATMADLMAVGGFACGHKSLMYATRSYAISAAMDTSQLIDVVNCEVMRRLRLSHDHYDHLLAASPEDLALLAANFVRQYAMSAIDFANKATLLSEARQDVARLQPAERLNIAINDGDLPISAPWVERLCEGYERLLPKWNSSFARVETWVDVLDEKFG